MITGNEPVTAIIDTCQMNTQFHTGHTIRQHYAGLAMQGMVCNPAIMQALTSSELITGNGGERVAEMSVKYADALIAELNKTK